VYQADIEHCYEERIVVTLPGEHSRPAFVGVEEAIEELDLLFGLCKTVTLASRVRSGPRWIPHCRFASSLYGASAQRRGASTPTPQSVRVDLLTDVAIKLTLNARLLQEEPGSSLAAYYTRIRELQRSMARPGWNEVRQTRAIRAANDPFIPVLVDRDTASAGESFVQCLLQMDNVVLIGVNTKGLCLAALAVSA
jgi:hypothetical protein